MYGAAAKRRVIYHLNYAQCLMLAVGG